MIKTERKPTSVGEMLTEEFLLPMGLTQTALAAAMNVQPRLVNELCRNRRAITADTALMLSRAFGNTPEFWMNLQQINDLWEVMHDEKRRARVDLARPVKAA